MTMELTAVSCRMQQYIEGSVTNIAQQFNLFLLDMPRLLQAIFNAKFGTPICSCNRFPEEAGIRYISTVSVVSPLLPEGTGVGDEMATGSQHERPVR